MNKKIYEVTISELLSKSFEVEAISNEDAIKKVTEKYKNKDIVLTADDFYDVEFLVTNVKKRK